MLYDVEFEYMIPEAAILTVDLDETLDAPELEAEALMKIKEDYNDVIDLNILNISPVVQ